MRERERELFIFWCFGEIYLIHCCFFIF